MTCGRRPVPVVVALGSNLGNRRVELERAVRRMSSLVRVVRVSPVFETDPVDTPKGSGQFLNMVVVGWTTLDPHDLLNGLHAIEAERRRVRRVRNEPRYIDLDLILYGAYMMRRDGLEIPHPRFRGRAFVMEPLRSLKLPWFDPVSGSALA